MKLPIASIVVGERRREDLGDISGLAHSLDTYGLIHPVVVDAGNRLVAGGRRLAAAQALGWQDIEARSFGELTEDDLRALELEENLRRKDLTAAERSRLLVRKAADVAPIISAQSAEKAPQGRKPAYEAPREAVAQAIGVSEASLRNAEQHVAAVDRYPVLEPLPQRTAIETAETLDHLPEPTRLAVITSIEQAAPADRPKVARETVRTLDIEAIAGAAGLSSKLADQRLRSAWSDVAYRIGRDLLPLNAERVAEILDEGRWQSFERTAADVAEWFDRVRAARGRGLRIIGGAK